MNEENLSTGYATAIRSGPLDLERQQKIFADSNLHSYLLDSSANCVLVLNKFRQIVYVNQTFKDLFGKSDIESLMGRRPGEVLNCQNAFINIAGCGTSEFCKTCGAVNAILSSLSGNEDVQECRILVKDSAEALDLRVWTRPLVIDNENFSVFSFVDISHEKRRQTLERIFFHDVLNTADAIRSFIKILPGSSEHVKKDLMQKASTLVDKLIEEIEFQRDFSLAEINELTVNPHKCNAVQLITDISNQYRIFPISDKKEITVETDYKEILFISDAVMVSRILSNMLKNALEATEPGGNIRIGINKCESYVRFYVHNEEYINPEIQGQIFQRSFSTKGKGRGLGTYSMKLLAERYLRGKVFFNSSQKEGTTFTLELPLYFAE